MIKFDIETTKKEQFIDITSKVQDLVKKSKIKDGLCLVYVPHTTCSIIINENADSNICEDIIKALSTIIPSGKWEHDKIDNNASAHIKSAMIGCSQIIPIEDNKLTLGRWQAIMLAEFDGPRTRNVIISYQA
jgi:secondary thiamine-phosphate synthase enzyme